MVLLCSLVQVAEHVESAAALIAAQSQQAAAHHAGTAKTAEDAAARAGAGLAALRKGVEALRGEVRAVRCVWGPRFVTGC